MSGSPNGFILGLRTIGVVLALCMILPIFVIIPVSLTPDRFLSLPTTELSLRHYENLFTNPVWLNSAKQSLVVGLFVTLFAVAIGTLGAIGLWRIAGGISSQIRNVLLVPLIVPPVVSALAFYKAWAAYGILDTYVGVIVAHTVLAIPYVLISVSTSLASFDGRLEQAARSLGATPLYTITHVIIPNVKFGMISGGILAFLTSWDEIVVAIFITGRNVVTLPKQIWSGIIDNIDPTVAAVGSTFIVLTLAATSIRFFMSSPSNTEQFASAWK